MYVMNLRGAGLCWIGVAAMLVFWLAITAPYSVPGGNCILFNPNLDLTQRFAAISIFDCDGSFIVNGGTIQRAVVVDFLWAW